jgi:hypothetical protein
MEGSAVHPWHRFNRDARDESVAKMLHANKLVGYQPVMRWEYDIATEKQLSALQKFGVSIVSVKTKGQASKMLSILFDRPSREDHRSAESLLIGTSPRGSKCPLGQNPRR